MGTRAAIPHSLQDQLHELSTMVPCSNRAYRHDLVLEDACQDHGEVCSGTLVLSLCKTLAKWLQGRFCRMFNEGRGLAHQTLLGLNVTDPTPGKEVFAISVKSAVSWAISTLGNATPVADDNDEYPSYVSDLVAALYGGGVVVSDPVRAASLSQQHLVTKQIHSVIEQAKLGTMTKRRRDEVEYTHHLAKKIKTEGRFFRTAVT